MRRIGLVVAITFALMLGVVISGLVMYAVPVTQVTTFDGMGAAQETVTTQFMPSLGMMELMIIGGIVLMAIVGVVAMVTRRQVDVERRKRKHEDMTDPYLSEMADDGRLHLADDGELPEWVDDPGEEKLKRE